MSEDLFIRRLYKYKGIGVIVEIDLIQKTVSLVEQMGNQSTFQNKKWVFAERQLEYMAGWQLILDAMKHAISEATKELETLKDRDDKKFIDMLVALHEPLKKGKK